MRRAARLRRLARLLADEDGCPRAVPVRAHGQRVAALRARHRQRELRRLGRPAAACKAPANLLRVGRHAHADDPPMRHVARLRELDEPQHDGERARRGLIARKVLRREGEPVRPGLLSLGVPRIRAHRLLPKTLADRLPVDVENLVCRLLLEKKKQNESKYVLTSLYVRRAPTRVVFSAAELSYLYD